LVSAKRFITGPIIGVIVIADEKINKPYNRFMTVDLTSANSERSVTIYCSANRTRFRMLQPEYEAIMHGVTFPE